MPTGAITGYIDVAQLVLYAFWIFFAGLIFYLRREDKREGYPLVSDRTDRTDRVRVQGFPAIPSPKTFKLADGRTVQAPRQEPPERKLAAVPAAPFPGAPMTPSGNPMKDGVGPASWVSRSDEPDKDAEGEVKIAPMRTLSEFSIAVRDSDPRGLPVVGADNKQAGTVHDVWVDKSEMLVRYLEVELPKPEGSGEGEGQGQSNQRGKRVLLPMNLCRVNGFFAPGKVQVKSILAEQFNDVPTLRRATQVTLLEEDKITAYFGGGHMYATPARQEPLF